MNTDNAKSQMRKGMLEYCVSVALEPTSFLRDGYHRAVEGGRADCCRGNALPIAFSLEKGRASLLSVAGVDTRASQEVL